MNGVSNFMSSHSATLVNFLRKNPFVLTQLLKTSGNSKSFSHGPPGLKNLKRQGFCFNHTTDHCNPSYRTFMMAVAMFF